MLVVITILGILGAIVSLSMIGITDLAQKRANDGERLMVQSAMDFMMMDQRIDPAIACNGAPAGGTNDMSKFPNAANDSQPATGQPVSLFPRYLRKQHLHQSYVCATGGAVRVAGS
jgi:type II secretory pathway pseudopilin PulG